MAAKKVNKSDEPRIKARLDKWLWAARLYKTRAIAKQAVEGGKVYCEGLRAKPSKEIEEGMKLELSTKFDGTKSSHESTVTTNELFSSCADGRI